MSKEVPRWARWQPMNSEPCPPGFHRIVVIVSDSEYEHIKGDAIWTGSGLFSAALRRMAGLPEVPYGIVAALKRQREAGTEVERK